MEQKILGISGAKQSGKTTSTNFIHGYQLRFYDVVSKFLMNDQGDLLINVIASNEKGEEEEGVGVLDVFRTDEDFVDYASQMIWPYVKAFSFADPLKLLSIHLFGLTPQQCYGTDEDKNTKVDIQWKNIPGKSKSAKKITAREFLQFFGTDICRKIKPDVWTSSCISRIHSSNTELAVVSDCRFPNEVDAIKNAGGKVVRLTRSPHKDEHESETALDNGYNGYDIVIDNAKMSIDETNMALLNALKSWGWLQVKAG